MKVEHLIETLRKHISLAENSKYCAEQSNSYTWASRHRMEFEEKSNKYDDEMQEIERHLMEELGIELDSYGEIYKETK